MESPPATPAKLIFQSAEIRSFLAQNADYINPDGPLGTSNDANAEATGLRNGFNARPYSHACIANVQYNPSKVHDTVQSIAVTQPTERRKTSILRPMSDAPVGDATRSTSPDQGSSSNPDSDSEGEGVVNAPRRVPVSHNVGQPQVLVVGDMASFLERGYRITIDAPWKQGTYQFTGSFNHGLPREIPKKNGHKSAKESYLGDPKPPTVMGESAPKKLVQRKKITQPANKPIGTAFIQSVPNMCGIVDCFIVFQDQETLEAHLYKDHKLERGKSSTALTTEVDACPWSNCGRLMQRRSMHRHIVRGHFRKVFVNDGDAHVNGVVEVSEDVGQAGPSSRGQSSTPSSSGEVQSLKRVQDPEEA